MVKIIAEGNDGRYSATQLLEIMEALRSPDGCPWDKVQTNDSIKMSAVEEAYEPFLIMEGYLDRTPKGRVATDLAFERLGLKR